MFLHTTPNLKNGYGFDRTLFEGFSLFDDALPAGEKSAKWQRFFRPELGQSFNTSVPPKVQQSGQVCMELKTKPLSVPAFSRPQVGVFSMQGLTFSLLLVISSARSLLSFFSLKVSVGCLLGVHQFTQSRTRSGCYSCILGFPGSN